MDKYQWKLGVSFSVALLLLIGMGMVLLRTHQAPLPLGKEEIQDEIVAVAAATDAQSLDAKPLSQDEFRMLGAEVMKSLPSSSSSLEVGLPILNAGLRFSPIEEAIRKEPSLADEGILLYLECGKSSHLPVSVRALCVTYLEQHKKNFGKKVSTEMIPRRISDLAKTLAAE
jgi:hypothetical protein